MATAEDKRRRILAAAVRVFAPRATRRRRVGDVAKEAGVAYGLVYHYFGSKDAVLEAVFHERGGACWPPSRSPRRRARPRPSSSRSS